MATECRHFCKIFAVCGLAYWNGRALHCTPTQFLFSTVPWEICELVAGWLSLVDVDCFHPVGIWCTNQFVDSDCMDSFGFSYYCIITAYIPLMIFGLLFGLYRLFWLLNPNQHQTDRQRFNECSSHQLFNQLCSVIMIALIISRTNLCCCFLFFNEILCIWRTFDTLSRAFFLNICCRIKLHLEYETVFLYKLASYHNYCDWMRIRCASESHIHLFGTGHFVQ